MDGLLLSILDVLRHRLGTGLVVSSGYRCPDCNAAVGGAASSQHLAGKAADILVPDGVDLDYVADLARTFGAGGVGRYYAEGFVHIDVRDDLADW